MSLRIEDYALIGNLQTAALVGNNGSIDWLCLPRFDSSACFAAILGDGRHGHWQIEPEGSYQVKRWYREGTLVLETEFHAAHGTAKVVDCMVPEEQGADLVRIVEGIRGEVRLRMTLKLRFDYGSIIPWIQYKAGELLGIAGPDMVHLYSGVELRGSNEETVCEFTVKEGQKVHFVLNWHPSYKEQPAHVEDPYAAVEAVTQWWKNWSKRSAYQGPYAKEVHASLVTLKALIHAPSGGIVAAPTTSLPEEIGGVRNWDYRFCWVRDATFTLYSLMLAGYYEEAEAWREWLLRAVAGRPSDMRLMYGITGERRLNEFELSWLPGYEGSRPVRVGNRAFQQVQLDVYGELMDAFHLARRGGLVSSDSSWSLEQSLVEHLETVWTEPDDGIWEVRGPKRQFTHSKVMAWVALDRAIKAIEQFGNPGPLERWRQVRQKIHDEVCAKGFNPGVGAFVQYYGGTALDASILMLPLVGFLPASDPRMISTVRAIEEGLMEGGFVMRYSTKTGVDGLPGGEGAFLACSFWLVDNMTLQGRHAEAEELFARLLAIRNDVGLLAEEYSPFAKRQVGNFPQAFSHIALVNSADNLGQAQGPASDRKAHERHCPMGVCHPRKAAG